MIERESRENIKGRDISLEIDGVDGWLETVGPENPKCDHP